MIIDQVIFSLVIILLILITYLLRVYGYCLEKFDLGHYWDGLIGLLLLSTVTDVSTICAVVIFRVKVSCNTSVDGIKLWLLT